MVSLSLDADVIVSIIGGFSSGCHYFILGGFASTGNPYQEYYRSAMCVEFLSLKPETVGIGSIFRELFGAAP